MYAKDRVSETNRMLTVGVLVTVLAVFVLSLGSAATAAPLADIPCEECAKASDPVEYTSLVAEATAKREASIAASAARYSALAAMYAGDREMSAASEGSLTLGTPADPTWLVPLSARIAADRELRAVSEGSLTLGTPADPTWLMPLRARAVADGEMDAASSAYAARLEALADCYAPSNQICSIK